MVDNWEVLGVLGFLAVLAGIGFFGQLVIYRKRAKLRAEGQKLVEKVRDKLGG